MSEDPQTVTEYRVIALFSYETDRGGSVEQTAVGEMKSEWTMNKQRADALAISLKSVAGNVEVETRDRGGYVPEADDVE